MAIDDYKKGMKYELFIRSAMKCERNKNGADLSLMQNAITIERGESYSKHLGSFEKQFEKVKNYTSKALLKLIKSRDFQKDKSLFETLQKHAIEASTTDELMVIIENAFERIVNRD